MSARLIVKPPANGNPAASRCCIRPDATVAYIDCVRIWTRRPPSAQDFAPFRGLGRHKVTAPRPFAFPRWRIDFYQPEAAALAAIARRHDWHLSYAEVALDWVFADDDARDDAKDFFDRHHVQLWHRGEVRFVERTRYSRGREARFNIAAYDTRPSKVTGEPCLHIEARVSGAGTLRRIGIDNAADLIRFDHYAFWRKHLRFADLDIVGFGRHVLNRQTGGRRRTPLIRCYGRRRSLSCDLDQRAGWLHLHISRSVQMLIHHCKKLTVQRYLIPIVVPDELLPKAMAQPLHISNYMYKHDSTANSALKINNIPRIHLAKPFPRLTHRLIPIHAVLVVNPAPD